MAEAKTYIVKEDPSLVRDGHSKAIINRNTNDYIRRLVAKEREEAKKAEIEDLKTQVQELTSLVQSLVAANKSQNNL
jgi:ABC-type proline/glycine betaine transport system ATPase subunit